MDLLNYWNKLGYDNKRIYKFSIIILVIILSYVIFPLISNFLFSDLGYFQKSMLNMSISFILTTFFAFVLIGILILIYHITPYSKKKLPLVLISYFISFLASLFLWRITYIQISNLSFIMNDFIFFLLYFPLWILFIARSIGKILIEKIDYKIKATILREISKEQNGITIWKIRTSISQKNLVLLDSGYKKQILEKMPKIIRDLRERNFIRGFKFFYLTSKGTNIIKFYFKSN